MYIRGRNRILFLLFGVVGSMGLVFSGGCAGPDAATKQDDSPSAADVSARSDVPATEQKAETPTPTAPKPPLSNPDQTTRQPRPELKPSGNAFTGQKTAAVPGKPNMSRVLPRQSTGPQGSESQRQEAEDLIYATIRVRMEEMIINRRDLLKAGHKPSDVEVRKLEGGIMRARQLLIENGEEVKDVDPPIIQSKP